MKRFTALAAIPGTRMRAACACTARVIALACVISAISAGDFTIRQPSMIAAPSVGVSFAPRRRSPTAKGSSGSTAIVAPGGSASAMHATGSASSSHSRRSTAIPRSASSVPCSNAGQIMIGVPARGISSATTRSLAVHGTPAK